MFVSVSLGKNKESKVETNVWIDVFRLWMKVVVYIYTFFLLKIVLIFGNNLSYIFFLFVLLLDQQKSLLRDKCVVFQSRYIFFDSIFFY